MGRTLSGQDLLLFRAVQEPQRRATVLQMLDASITSGAPHPDAQCDAWELYDATGGADEPPVAVATTRPLDDGRIIELTAIAVASSRRRQGIGRRLIDDLSDAHRARGAMLLITTTTADGMSAATVLQRWGFRQAPHHPPDDPPPAAGATFAIEL
ncbi:MAG: GNAT family N-acetyltransferase [Aldersonia sp.]|nr:GNAT family N-acetyltransferase [Aldersonia sp.]